MHFNFKKTDLENHLRNSIPIEKLIERLLGNPKRKTINNCYFLCPFHNEETASLCTSKMWHNNCYCFGCGSGGDTFKFISTYYNMPSWDFKFISIFLMLLFNYLPEEQYYMNQKARQRFAIYSLKFNFVFLLTLGHLVLSPKDEKVIFISDEKLSNIKTELNNLGFSNRDIKKLHFERMSNKYILIKSNVMFIEDFIVYDNEKDTCYSVLYKHYSQAILNYYCRKIKDQI